MAHDATSAAPDPKLCPLCGNANECGMEKCQDACWCFNLSIRPDTLERVPPEARGRACICRACASGWVGPSRPKEKAQRQ